MPRKIELAAFWLLLTSLLSAQGNVPIEGAEVLRPFFERLTVATLRPVRILQFGDSHTASDDWAPAMEQIFQRDYGFSVTWENYGVNGAHARTLLVWNEDRWDALVRQKWPTLIVLAYGTNEALYPYWTAESYRSDLAGIIQRFQSTVPDAPILFVGPPACGRGKKFGHLDEVIAIQRRIALANGCAFWNWRAYVNRTGGRSKWLRDGLSRPDFVHFTREGYQLVGDVLAKEIEREFQQYQAKEAGHHQ